VKRLLASVAAAALACCAAGCGSGGGGDGGSSAERPVVTVEPTQTLLVMGSSATFGVGLENAWQDAWPRIFYREAFPRATVFVNGALQDASIADAELHQLPLVGEVSPSVVAIWLGGVEVALGMPVAQFATELEGLVRQVRASGARVLLADLPRSRAADVDPYNRAIARIASDDGATLVPLHAEAISSFDRSGSVPDVAGNRTIAHAFERALHD
jgi:lysophospholipase L1-like esterase